MHVADELRHDGVYVEANKFMRWVLQNVGHLSGTIFDGPYVAPLPRNDDHPSICIIGVFFFLDFPRYLGLFQNFPPNLIHLFFKAGQN